MAPEPYSSDSTGAHALSPGDLVGHYVLMEEIGSGGAGRVFAARHHVLGYERALKIMHLHESTREDAMNRWRREAVLLSQIQHGNIVRVHDAGLVPGTSLFFIVMDLLHGHTLREYLKLNRSIPVAKALHYASEIADGVQAAHELHVVHRDIKPENVFITDANEVKVLDLGTAKVQGYGVKTTDQFRVRGTIPYMAPEQCEGLQVDVRTDVYALGIVLYEMIAGRHPFIRPDDPFPSRYELVTRQLVAEPEPLSYVVRGCPDYIWRVVERALRKDPDSRFSTMLEFGLALREARNRALKAADPKNAASAAAAVVHVPAPRNRAVDSAAKTPVLVHAVSPKRLYGPRGTFKMEDASGGAQGRGQTAPLRVHPHGEHGGNAAAAVAAHAESGGGSEAQPKGPSPSSPSGSDDTRPRRPFATRSLYGALLGACLAVVVLGLLRVIVDRDSASSTSPPETSSEPPLAVLEAPPVAPAPAPLESGEVEVSPAEIDAVLRELGSPKPAASAATSVAQKRVRAPAAPTSTGIVLWDELGKDVPPTARTPKAPKGDIGKPAQTGRPTDVRSGL